MKVIGIIPARFASTRLPGKPLMEICGKPMIWWVYMNAKRVRRFSSVIVATDDIRIKEYCILNGFDVVLTQPTHLTAAERIYEVSIYKKADFYVQINGDEPLITHNIIDSIIPDYIVQEQEYGINLISKIKHESEIYDPSNIKVIFDSQMNALYMSRTPIPYFNMNADKCYYKHIGVIGYNNRMLKFYANSSPGYLEKTENIDTLRFIDYGKTLKFREVDIDEILSVDTQKDIIEVEKRMKSLI